MRAAGKDYNANAWKRVLAALNVAVASDRKLKMYIGLFVITHIVSLDVMDRSDKPFAPENSSIYS